MPTDLKSHITVGSNRESAKYIYIYRERYSKTVNSSFPVIYDQRNILTLDQWLHVKELNPYIFSRLLDPKDLNTLEEISVCVSAYLKPISNPSTRYNQIDSNTLITTASQGPEAPEAP